MIQGTPTSIPVQSVDADQLPREKGLTIEEVSSIIGSLYLDSHHQMKVREEQFSAVIEEYDKRIMQLQAELVTVNQEVLRVRTELEKRDARTSTTPSNDGQD